jgi:hypothetical protein
MADNIRELGFNWNAEDKLMGGQSLARQQAFERLRSNTCAPARYVVYNERVIAAHCCRVGLQARFGWHLLV